MIMFMANSQQTAWHMTDTTYALNKWLKTSPDTKKTKMNFNIETYFFTYLFVNGC